MNRNFIYLLMVVLVLVFFSSSQAQCPEDLTDLGICDTFYVVPWFHTDTCFVINYPAPDTICINDPGEHFPCFLYVNLFVTHDSNTFWWEDDSSWIQDSLAAFLIPLLFWHQSEGGADSVIFPNWDNWNNTIINPYDPRMNRSMFRHFVDSRTGDTVYYNRILRMVEAGKDAWNVYTDIESHSSDTDSGKCSFFVVSMSPTSQRWWEGSRVFLATLTFQVYMPEGSDTTEICIDSTLWPPTSNLTFVRYDAKIYVPRHFLPICFRVYDDTVEIISTDVRWIEGSTEEESRPTIFSVSRNYPNPFNPVTNFKVTLPEASHVKIEIFNILGQKVKTLVDEDMRAGVFIVDWDGKDDRGLEVSSGIYFYRIIAGEFSDIKKMVLLK